MKGIMFKPWKAEAIRTMGTDRDWQTRRVMKPQPEAGDEPRYDGTCAVLQGDWYKQTTGPHAGEVSYVAWYWRPKYKAGETVYVKERYRFHWLDDSSDGKVEYSDGSTKDILDLGHKWRNSKWRSPMFMPEFAARTLLLITGVRVERTRDISVSDCWAEGIGHWPSRQKLDWTTDYGAHESYFALYDSINGAGAHERNWDWVYEFRRVEGVVP